MTLLRRGPHTPTTAGEPALPAGPGADGQPGARPDVQVSDEQHEVPLDAGTLGELAVSTLLAEGVTGDSELTLTFVDEATMASLNEQHMGEPGPTDVLAFPLDDPHEPRPAGMAALLGDVVICPAVAARYAAAADRPLDHELALLVVHGVLHVLGHDHAEAEQATQMRRQELAHLRAFVDPVFQR